MKLHLFPPSPGVKRPAKKRRDDARQGMNALTNKLRRMNPALYNPKPVSSPIHRALLISGRQIAMRLIARRAGHVIVGIMA